MRYSRFLNMEDIAPRKYIVPLDDRRIRQYQNLAVYNLLANEAGNRDVTAPLIANVFRMVTDYWLFKVFRQSPEGIDDEILRVFKDALWWRSLYGYGVVVRQGDRFHAVSPRFWWPILVRGIKIGSAIIQPYSTVSPVGGNINATLPNRAWAIVAIDGVDRAIVRDFEYTGITLGNVVSREEVSPIRVEVFGDGVSDYSSLEPLATELDKRLKGTSVILDRYQNPHLQVPASSISFDDNGNPMLNLNLGGSILPVQRDDKDYKYLTLQADRSLVEFQVRMILSMISALTEIPASHFGLTGLPRMESGSGVLALGEAAQCKMGVLREEVLSAMRELGIDASFPADVEAQATEENGNDTDNQS